MRSKNKRRRRTMSRVAGHRDECVSNIEDRSKCKYFQTEPSPKPVSKLVRKYSQVFIHDVTNFDIIPRRFPENQNYTPLVPLMLVHRFTRIKKKKENISRPTKKVRRTLNERVSRVREKSYVRKIILIVRGSSVKIAKVSKFHFRAESNDRMRVIYRVGGGRGRERGEKSVAFLLRSHNSLTDR